MKFVLALAAVAVAAVSAGSASAAAPSTLWAAPTGGGSACVASAPCSLSYAVSHAAAGATVRARGGTYQGGIVVATPLQLVGEGGATLDASTSPNGVGIQITASGSSVDHFTVENAKFEGILVGTSPGNGSVTSGTPVSDVTIDHSTVIDNDQGFSGVIGEGDGECFTTPFAPGDCGGGIHLVSVTHSVVEHTRVQSNSDGILLTDEFGENAYNTIAYDTVLDNTTDCGITLAGHGSAGVHDNLIEYDVSDRNGVAGQGAGILLAGAGPFTAVYHNVVSNDESSGNGLSGITIHEHFLANLTGNVLENNTLSNDNLDGDFDFITPDPSTTGILVAAGSPFPGAPFPPPPLTGTVISGNHIGDVQIGIWTLNAPSTIVGNHFGRDVTTPVSNN